METHIMFNSLPDELIIEIMKACTLQSLNALSQTGKRLNAIKNASEVVWKAQVSRMGSITDDCVDLSAAIASQYSTTHYFSDCTTWRRLFMKLHLTNLNWIFGHYSPIEIKLEDPDFDIWHIKLDHIKGAIMVTNVNGGIRFINFQGNTLYDLPTTTSQYPHCEFDGTYMTFMKDDNDHNKMQIWKRVSDDSYEFAPYAVLEMPRGISPRCYRLKDHHLLVACPFVYQHTCFCDLTIFDLEDPDRLAVLSLVGTPQYVDFDDDLLYVVIEPVQLDDEDGPQPPNPLAMLFRPPTKDFMSLDSANSMLGEQWRDMRTWSAGDVASHLQDVLSSKQVIYDMPTTIDPRFRDEAYTAAHVDVRSRLSQAHIVAISGREVWHSGGRHDLAQIAQKYQLQAKSIDFSSETDDGLLRQRYAAFMTAIHAKTVYLPKGVKAYNLAVCNSRCVFALDCSAQTEHLLVIKTALSAEDGDMYMIPAPSSREVRTLMMDDTMVLANQADNVLMLLDFSADVDTFWKPSTQIEETMFRSEIHGWSS